MPKEADRTPFAILDLRSKGWGVKRVAKELGAGPSRVRRVDQDVEVRDRWRAYQHATNEWEKRKRDRDIVDTVIEHACITTAAAAHGVSRVTVYKAIQRTNAMVEVRVLVTMQRTLAELAAGKHAVDAVNQLAAIVSNAGEAPVGRARAAETLRKFLAEPTGGGARHTTNFAAAERGGVAVAGDNAEASAMSVDLPTPPHERSMPLALVHSVSRAIIEAENAGAMPPVLEVKGDDFE